MSAFSTIQGWVWFAMALGGGLGTVARFVCSRLSLMWLGSAFPWGTLLVNVVGSALLGYFLRSSDIQSWGQPELRLIIGTGFLGGFTTFSAFSVESLELWINGKAKLAILNLVANVLVGLVAAAVGWYVAKALEPIS